MKILMLNIRDLKNPKSGGAEVLIEGILKLLAKKHDITIFASSFPEGLDSEIVDGYRVIRKGSQYTVHFWAMVYWFKQFRQEKFDLVIDQIHGIPFFTKFYIRNTKIIALIHEVAKEIWMKMFLFPVSWIGFIMEPLILRQYKKIPFITVSDSTKKDLVEVGILEKNISLMPEAIEDDLHSPLNLSKEKEPTLIYLGRLALMKNPEELIEAFRIAHQKNPKLKLWMVGRGEPSYIDKLKVLSQDLPIIFFNYVDANTKKELLSKAWLLVSASVKEGFGLVVIEAAAQGTPCVVYDVAGFRDSVKNLQTGLLCPSSPESLAMGIFRVVEDQSLYNQLRINAIEYSRNFTFQKASEEFEKLIQKL